ncbi:hypothetical protein [Ulvibacterium marinum]|uniref:hypothetical protein n=1 Tax=Ulvibacterium marinum TaxID=2419782 RepID=UPI00249487FB|nr:hypothetical protein [Ulvibacterium marinum]
MERNEFIKKSMAFGGIATLVPTMAMSRGKRAIEELFDQQEISEFVSAAHKSLEDTQKIIEAKPLLLNCTSQLAKGDFETAIGGASHMGRKDIADFLVSKGARLDIFNYTFLGYDDFVRKLIMDHPHLLNAPGPHGFSLLHHAEVGERKELAAWLQEKGLAETFFKGVFG